jgi:hypothetical protein
LVQVLQDGPDVGTGAPPEEAATEFRMFQARLEPPLTSVEQNAPAVVRQDVEILGRQARYAVTTRTVEPVQTPEFNAALTRTRTTIIEQCELAQVRVTATDYKYEGIPAAVAAGTVAGTLINQGDEPHEIVIFRIDPGEGRPFRDLISLPQPERGQFLTSIETSLSADPGNTDTELLHLAPGRYGAACLIPQGSTAAELSTGPPHATIGEAAEFTVR